MKTEYKRVLFPFSIFRIGIFVISIFLLSCKGSPKQNEATAQNAVESIQGCKCYDGIGASKNDAPKLTYTFENNKTVIVCGFADDNMHAQGTIVSEFNVFDCDTGESYAEYGATKICRIQEKQNELEI